MDHDGPGRVAGGGGRDGGAGRPLRGRPRARLGPRLRRHRRRRSGCSPTRTCCAATRSRSRAPTARSCTAAWQERTPTSTSPCSRSTPAGARGRAGSLRAWTRCARGCPCSRSPTRAAAACATRSASITATGRSFRGPRGRRIGGSLEHTAPLPRGSSGGPVVDGEGRLLGLNTVRLEGGLILALPADAALRARVDGLARGETPARPRLGVALAPPRAAGGCARRSGCPSATGCSCAASRTGARRGRGRPGARRPPRGRRRARPLRLRRPLRRAGGGRRHAGPHRPPWHGRARGARSTLAGP